VSPSRWAATPIGRLVIAAAIVGLAGGVTACDAGTNAPTLEFHPQSDGVDTAVHGIKILDAFVLGAPSGSLAAGQSAGLFLALYNDGNSADSLIGVSAAGVARSVTLPAGGIGLPSQQAVYLTGPKPTLVLTGLLHALPSGGAVQITLSFLNAGSISLDLPVLERAGAYQTFSPAPAPAVSPKKTPSPSPTTSTSPSATSSPSPTPTS
jgi:copper(I)-binding protein